MNGHVAERSLRKRTSAIEAELDALVAREVAALQRAATRDQPRTASRKRGGAAEEAPLPPREARAVFEEKEEEFIARTAAFLSGRPDRDVLLEAIWSRVLTRPDATEQAASSLEPAAEAPPAEAGEDNERHDP